MPMRDLAGYRDAEESRAGAEFEVKPFGELTRREDQATKRKQQQERKLMRISSVSVEAVPDVVPRRGSHVCNEPYASRSTQEVKAKHF
jgi:hypothetical protein